MHQQVLHLTDVEDTLSSKPPGSSLVTAADTGTNPSQHAGGTDSPAVPPQQLEAGGMVSVQQGNDTIPGSEAGPDASTQGE